MWLIKLAWKNMWRSRGRTIITMAAIYFAVILSVLASSLKDGIFDNLVKNIVSFYTGYIQVHKQGYWDEQILENSFESASLDDAVLLENENVRGITPRLESFALISFEDITRGSLVVGVDPDKENEITGLENKLIAGKYFRQSESSLLIAEGLANRLGLNTGDTVVLLGQGYHGATAAGKYPISGIVKFGSPDLNDRVAYLPLAAAQELYSAYGMVTSYILSINDPAQTDQTVTALKPRLGEAYEVMSWSEMMPEVKQHIESDSQSMQYIQGILYLLICFGIFGTLLMMMVERNFEMGMLVAIGMKKYKLMILYLLESISTVLAGCLLGIATSIPIIYYLNRHPIRLGGDIARAYERFGFEAIFPTSLALSNFLTQGLTVLIIGLVLSLYPIYKIAMLNPVTAMKR